MALTHRLPRPAFGAFCALLALGLLAGCGGSGPNLRALNAREAKIEVFPNGEVRVLGERIEMGELSEVVKNSSTQPQDTVLIKLHGDPDSPEFVTLRKYVTDQMFRGGHVLRRGAPCRGRPSGGRARGLCQWHLRLGRHRAPDRRHQGLAGGAEGRRRDDAGRGRPGAPGHDAAGAARRGPGREPVAARALPAPAAPTAGELRCRVTRT